MTDGAAAALGHREAERAALGHPGRSPTSTTRRASRRCTRETNPDYYDLIRRSSALTGCPVSSTRPSTCAASRSSARRRTPTAASCAPTSTTWCSARSCSTRREQPEWKETDELAAGIPARLTTATLSPSTFAESHDSSRSTPRHEPPRTPSVRIARRRSVPRSDRDRAVAAQAADAGAARSDGLGIVLVLAGLVVPRLLGKVYAGWMGFALVLSKVTTPIFMGVIYFVVLTPTGFLMRMFGWRRAGSRVEGHGMGYAARRRARELPGTAVLTTRIHQLICQERQKWRSRV